MQGPWEGEQWRRAKVQPWKDRGQVTCTLTEVTTLASLVIDQTPRTKERQYRCPGLVPTQH